ncbi:hypothetical protein M7I_2973 [Glarea lozoyensis 74030]|uniref:Uncharacterized protein n=1 Tax=Glarea lozoyensis (strain ATCC 74030 / MF5533) TaxID=1104152 RepID=H0EK81_GLAL7|nr:hypothetical protein M7I_2973 [Glarea lozoyensis 74030]
MLKFGMIHSLRHVWGNISAYGALFFLLGADPRMFARDVGKECLLAGVSGAFESDRAPVAFWHDGGVEGSVKNFKTF